MRAVRPPGLAQRPASDEELVRSLLGAVEAAAVIAGARRVGVSPSEEALARGVLDENRLARGLAKAVGGVFVDLDEFPVEPVAPPAEWRRVLRARCFLAKTFSGALILVVAPEAGGVDRLLKAAGRESGFGGRLAVATPGAFDRFVRRWAEAEWLADGVDNLRQVDPDASASDAGAMRRAGLVTLALVLALTVALVAAPPVAATTLGAAAAALFLLFALFRAAAILAPPPTAPPPVLSDADLPRYSVILALHDEAAVAADLMAAMTALDYPPAKVDLIAVVEVDDGATAAALRAADPAGRLTIIVAPAFGPRTKPKALMLALPFVRGRHVVVYDAEDRPHPRQLREAAEVFAGGDLRLGCLQAPLSIDETRPTGLPTLLTRLFAIEYDALFRVFLPALTRWGLPTPLGGTSNHFRGIR